MAKFAITALAAITLLHTAPAMAADKPIESKAKPSSFVPHARGSHHVYGAPIQSAIVGHVKIPHAKHNRKKAPLTRTNRDGS